MNSIDALINGYLEDELQPGEFQELQELLRTDPEARRQFYEALALDQELAKTFEPRDFVSIHARAVKATWADQQQKVRNWRRSLLTAAAVLLAGGALGLLLHSDAPGYLGHVNLSEDCVLATRGGRTTEHSIAPGTTVEVKRGILNIELTPHVEAVVEGPAEFKVLDRHGNVELRRGRAVFEISPGGRGLEVTTPSAVLRDIGTSFGVAVEEGREEVHVMSGLLELLDQGQRLDLVHAGQARSYLHGHVAEVPFRPETFARSIPRPTFLLKDDFNEEDGTLLAGKLCDIGGRWMVLQSARTFRINDGRLDTSHGSKSAVAGFQTAMKSEAIYILSFQSLPPELDDPLRFAGGLERISLAIDSRPVLGVAARGTQGHRWYIEYGTQSAEEGLSSVSALERASLMLIYDSSTGTAELFRLDGLRRESLSRRQLPAGLHFDSLLIANPERHGDVALDHVTVMAIPRSADFAEPPSK